MTDKIGDPRARRYTAQTGRLPLNRVFLIRNSPPGQDG